LEEFANPARKTVIAVLAVAVLSATNSSTWMQKVNVFPVVLMAISGLEWKSWVECAHPAVMRMVTA